MVKTEKKNSHKKFQGKNLFYLILSTCPQDFVKDCVKKVIFISNLAQVP